MNVTAVILTLAVWSAAGDADLRVLAVQDGEPQPSMMLNTYLRGLAHEAYARRRETFEGLKTVEQCTDYQKKLREFFLQQLGGLPERTPLEARVVGRLSRDDYSVEKIVYASRPQHHVTAALYLPKSEPPFPAVLIACGHSKNGKAADYNQRMGDSPGQKRNRRDVLRPDRPR